jgi:hypothetical protein
MPPSIQGTNHKGKYSSLMVLLSLAMTVLLSHLQGATAFSALPLIHHGHQHQHSHQHPHHLALARPFGLQTPLRKTASTSSSKSTSTRNSPTQLFALDILNEVAGAYNFALEHYTLPTEATTGAVFACIGDCIAQTFNIRDPDNKQTSYSLARTRNFFIKGLGSGVIWSVYYRETEVLCADWATQLLSTTAQANSELAIASAKTALAVLLEEVIAMPVVMSVWDIPVPAILSGSPMSTIPGQVKSKIPELIVENAKVWTLVNILIYNIPVQYRLLVMSVANVFWQTIVSKITSQEVVLENAGAESLGIHATSTETDYAASLENKTTSADSRDVAFESIMGADMTSSMMAHTMEGSVMGDFMDDFAGAGSSMDQVLLDSSMESKSVELATATSGEVPAWVFQKTNSSTGGFSTRSTRDGM